MRTDYSIFRNRARLNEWGVRHRGTRLPEAYSSHEAAEAAAQRLATVRLRQDGPNEVIYRPRSMGVPEAEPVRVEPQPEPAPVAQQRTPQGHS